MLKHCRNLPRAGVGFLGLVLVLMFTLTAEAASLRRSGGSQTQGGMLFGVPEGADATSSPAIVTPPAVQEFSVAGSGSVNFVGASSDCIAVGLVCNAGETCQCVETTGTVTDGIGPFYHGAFSFILNIVTSATRQYPNGNNVGKVCFFASGVLSVTPGFPGSTINFITSGAACNGTGGGVALYSGGFAIGSSTGGFSNAIGDGVLGFGANFGTGIGIFDLKGAGTNLN